VTADPRLERLLSSAFHQASGADANSEIEKVRVERGSELAEALSYEGAAPPTGTVEWLVERFLPKLVYFLDCRGARLPQAPGVFVSLFVGDRVHFFEVEVLLGALSEWSGLGFDEMVQRWGANSV
jgi:hypothetical protein